MNILLQIGKSLDQPILVSKFSRAMPGVLSAGAAIYGIYDTYKVPEGEKQKTFIKNLCVLGATVGSALIATRGLKPVKMFGKQLFKGFDGLINHPGVKEVKKAQTELIEGFIKNSPTEKKVADVLNKAKEKVLYPSEIKFIHKQLGRSESGKKFLKELIPDPENITFKEILGKIGKLSLMGLVPVVGGISGGVAGDILTEKHWERKFPNKIKEGFYQYFANIFLCNVGAGAAFGVMEKMNVKSKANRAIGMIAGIMAMGVIGGSAIANYIGKKLINPLFDKGQSKVDSINNLYSERKPEAIDVGLHVDDVATVAVLSGLRWIEPALPIMYSISGYRAGMGYRNGEHCKQNKQRNDFHRGRYHNADLLNFKNSIKTEKLYLEGSCSNF